MVGAAVGGGGAPRPGRRGNGDGALRGGGDRTRARRVPTGHRGYGEHRGGGEETFTRECQVNGAGAISYPKLGDLAAAGLTCEELQTSLEEGLRTYLKHPSVIVTVHQYGPTGMSVFVMGEVARPGAYPLASGGGFLQAVAAAGGLTENAERGQLSLLKARTKQTVTLVLADTGTSAVTLEPGDVILALRKEDARVCGVGGRAAAGDVRPAGAGRGTGAGRAGEGGAAE